MEAESIFNLMKMAGCPPDVVSYTAMLHAYSAAGKVLCLTTDILGRR